MKETGNDLTHLACVDANSCVWLLFSLNLIHGGVGDTFSCVGSVAACADAAKMGALKAEETRLLFDRLKPVALKETEVPDNARKRGARSILRFAELAAVAKLFLLRYNQNLAAVHLHILQRLMEMSVCLAGQANG